MAQDRSPRRSQSRKTERVGRGAECNEIDSRLRRLEQIADPGAHLIHDRVSAIRRGVAFVGAQERVHHLRVHRAGIVDPVELVRRNIGANLVESLQNLLERLVCYFKDRLPHLLGHPAFDLMRQDGIAVGEKPGQMRIEELLHLDRAMKRHARAGQAVCRQRGCS